MMEWGFTLLLGMCAILAYKQRKLEEKHAKFWEEMRNKQDLESIQPKDIETKVEEPVEK